MATSTETQPGIGGTESAALKPSTPNKGSFKAGHNKLGGRRPGSKNKRTKRAQELADAFGTDPVIFLLEVMTKDSVQVVLTDPITGEVLLDEATGQPKRVWLAIPIDMRVDAAKALAPYIHPKLQATQLTGKDDGPLDVGVDVATLLRDPAAVEAVQKVALALAANGQESAPGPGNE